jgi:hypothetical protein
MDLETVETKLMNGGYGNANQFAADIRQIWTNAQTYNRPESAIYQTSEALSKAFEKRFSKVKAAVKATTSRYVSDNVTREVSRLDRVKLSQLVSQLTSDQLGMLVDTVSRDSPEALTKVERDDELEIDVNSIDDTTLLSLLNFATQCVQAASSRKKKMAY